MAIRTTSINRLRSYIDNIMMRKVTKPMYVKLLHDLYDNGSAVNTIKTIHSTASLIFHHALHEEKVIKIDPTANVDFRFLTVEREATDQMELKDRDRKSTRLNSSHVAISYAVFCLK